MHIQKVFWLLLLALLVTACGGDSGPGNPNTAPFLTRNFADISSPSGEVSRLDLVTYFDDRDQDAATLSYEALSSDSAIVAATLISGSILELTFDGLGNATVVVTATDNDGLSATDSFVVTVADSTNTPPTSSSINNVTLLTSAPNQSLDLTTSFDDAEDGAQGLTYSAQSSNPNVVVVSTSGGTLTLEAQAEGTATITVTARDSDGATVSETFTVTVEDDGNGNTGPSLVTPIDDQIIGPDNPFTLDLSTFFDDLEDGSEGLIYSSNSSDDNVVVATVDGFILTLDPRELGSAEITITATDSEGLTIEDTFMVTVSEQPAEDPFIVRLFETITVFVGNPDITIDLTRYFDDNQDGPEGLTYTASSDNPAVVSVSIDPDGTDLVLDFGIAGNAVVTVTATDSDNNSVEATFFVIVQDINNGGNTPPTADNLTVQTDENTPVNTTLSGSDVDGDGLTFTVASQPANGTLTGTAPNLTYTPNTGFTGTDSFTYTVNDGEDTSNVATVTIVVNPIVAPNPRFEFVAGGSADQVLVRLVSFPAPNEWIGFQFDISSGGNVTLQNPPFGSESTGIGNGLTITNGTNNRSPITVGGVTTTPIVGGGTFAILNLEGAGSDTLTLSNGTLLLDDQGTELAVAGDTIDVTLASGGGTPQFNMTAGPGVNEVTVSLDGFTGNWFSFSFTTTGNVSVDAVASTGVGTGLLTSTGPNGTVGAGLNAISGSGNFAILTVSGTGTLTIQGGNVLTNLSASDGAPVTVSGSSITLP